MQTWWTSSPYFWFGVYIGGSNDTSCFAPTASWITTVNNQGWAITPIWSGDQDPCWVSLGGHSGPTFSLDTSTAFTQGETAANNASNEASSLGFASGAIIYFDLEGYDGAGQPATTGCKNAANSFIHGWDEELKTDGYSPGVVGASSSSCLDNLYNLTYNPDDGWASSWGQSTDTVWNLTSLPNADWENDKRLHQYVNHPSGETYGGATISPTDDDCALGEVDKASSLYAEGSYDTGETSESTQGPADDPICFSP